MNTSFGLALLVPIMPLLRSTGLKNEEPISFQYRRIHQMFQKPGRSKISDRSWHRRFTVEAGKSQLINN